LREEANSFSLKFIEDERSSSETALERSVPRTLFFNRGGLRCRRRRCLDRLFFGDQTIQVVPHLLVGLDDFICRRSGDIIIIAFFIIMKKPNLEGGG
jgi:hypothetical protein